MTSFKRALSIGTLFLGLAAVPATTYAQAVPLCFYEPGPNSVVVLQFGQSGAPGLPVLVGGYEIYSNGFFFKQVPLVGNFNLGATSLSMAWTTHFDYQSEDWNCPVGDTVFQTDNGPYLDVTYHGGDPAICPLGGFVTPQIIPCTPGIFPYDASIVNSLGIINGKSMNAK
jgi:hypothetical protein